MSFLRAARAALVGQTCFRWVLPAAVIVLAGTTLSCINNESVGASSPNHSAFVTLPADGSCGPKIVKPDFTLHQRLRLFLP